MRILRASEINAFLYCQRAWWYRLQGIPGENQAEMEAGEFAHQVQALRLRQAIWAVRFACVLMLLVVILVVWHLIA
jgi:CRISPR/Cas system-associated exonuclease Cas4 (RecB family)